MSSTDLHARYWTSVCSYGICYAMSGTDLAYAPTVSATRYPVPTTRMRLQVDAQPLPPLPLPLLPLPPRHALLTSLRPP
eukprot:3932886-Rhodomonas_salina.7